MSVRLSRALQRAQLSLGIIKLCIYRNHSCELPVRRWDHQTVYLHITPAELPGRRLFMGQTQEFAERSCSDNFDFKISRAFPSLRRGECILPTCLPVWYISTSHDLVSWAISSSSSLIPSRSIPSAVS